LIRFLLAAAYSTDGINWTGLGIILPASMNCGIWNGNKWVAGGKNSFNSFQKIAYSSDGFTWTPVNLPYSSIMCTSVIWGFNRFVATTIGAGANQGKSIAYSFDGITWNAASIFNSLDDAYSVAWNGKVFVAVGSGFSQSMMYSSDGINWNAVVGSSTIFTTGYGVTWNGKVFIAVGTGNNTIAISGNGQIWYGMGNSYMPTGLGVGSNSLFGGSVIDSQFNINPDSNFISEIPGLEVSSPEFYNLNYTTYNMRIESSNTLT